MRSRRIDLYINDALYDQLKAIGEQNGKCMAEICEDIIKKYTPQHAVAEIMKDTPDGR